MKRKPYKRLAVVVVLALAPLVFSGCSTAGGAASDLSLAGAGGVVGYELSDGKVGGAAAGAALGYVGSKVVQSQVKRAMTEAEKRGYDRAMNQAVKQQYWVIQNQQRSRETTNERDARLVAVVIPEMKINGVVQNAHVEYLPVQP
jgi:predicted small secreted protein